MSPSEPGRRLGGSVRPVVIINAVGLTPGLLPHAPRSSSIGNVAPWRSPVPAVTLTSQATMLTGAAPREHGIVGNGWWFRETDEIRFWQQSHRLLQKPVFHQNFRTAKLFWWFNGSPPAKYYATPKPHYGSDGSKVFDIIDATDCELTKKLGPFPFFSFWGPTAGLPASRWIADATAIVMRAQRPEITLAYLPHLDYDHQRLSDPPSSLVSQLDDCVHRILQAADDIGAEPIIVSEYGLTPVQRSVSLNRHLREAGLLGIRRGPFGDQLVPGDCRAFAVADHQVAHLYVADEADAASVAKLVEEIPGVAAVVEPGELELDHPRSGRYIVLAQRDAWFNYYFWSDDANAPDYARTVDIHRKPGYDPVELFATSRLRAAMRVVQKKLGFRYRMDVIPLRPELVGGSHGLSADDPSSGPLVIGQGDLPEDMRGFPDYVHQRLHR